MNTLEYMREWRLKNKVRIVQYRVLHRERDYAKQKIRIRKRPKKPCCCGCGFLATSPAKYIRGHNSKQKNDNRGRDYYHAVCFLKKNKGEENPSQQSINAVIEERKARIKRLLPYDKFSKEQKDYLFKMRYHLQKTGMQNPPLSLLESMLFLREIKKCIHTMTVKK